MPVTKKKNLKRKPTKKKQSFKKKITRIFLKMLIVGSIFFGLFFLAVYLGLTGHVPTSSQLHKIKNPQASEVFSAEGKLLGRYYVENRSNVRFDEISPNVVSALIATEDARFYEHRGIDEIALLRVLFKTILLQDRSAGGGSTLSQQIAKNLFPRNDLGIFSMPVNKLREAIIAYRLERIYTKNEILELYLNTVPFGENIFGIEVASERFFSKKPNNLTIDEAAVLVGMLKANYTYNPRINPEKSKIRRNIVIGQMVDNGFLDAGEGEVFKAKPLKVNYRKISYNQGPAPYFLEKLKPELLEWCKSHKKENGDPYNLYTDGLKIETTLNYDFQYYAQQSVNEYMKNLQKVFDAHWGNQNPWDKNKDILNRAIRNTERYQSMQTKGIPHNDIMTSFKEKIGTDLFHWDGIRHIETTPLDSLKHYLRMLNVGFVAMEPASGELQAWVGGIDFRFFQYDHVEAERQSGSTFKPFVYLSAIENGLSPFEYYPNEKKVYAAYQDWSPRNSHDNYTGFYSMEGALSESLNTVAVAIMMKNGIDETIETTRALGIEADLPKYPSLALGAASISLKEMVNAYANILNGGLSVQPHYLVSIKNSKGELLSRFFRKPAKPNNLNRENCRIVTHMLESVVEEGTGKAIRSVYKIPGDFAGKTGTTQNHADGWFIGMTPEIVAGCWVGASDPGVHFKTITYGQGGYMALPIVGKFFHKIYADPRYRELNNAKFEKPSPEILAQLNIPHYKELFELEREKNFFDRLLAKKNKPEHLKEKRKRDSQKKKKKVWETIKEIFRKKD